MAREVDARVGYADRSASEYAFRILRFRF